MIYPPHRPQMNIKTATKTKIGKILGRKKIKKEGKSEKSSRCYRRMIWWYGSWGEEQGRSSDASCRRKIWKYSSSSPLLNRFLRPNTLLRSGIWRKSVSYSLPPSSTLPLARGLVAVAVWCLAVTIYLFISMSVILFSQILTLQSSTLVGDDFSQIGTFNFDFSQLLGFEFSEDKTWELGSGPSPNSQPSPSPKIMDRRMIGKAMEQ